MANVKEALNANIILAADIIRNGGLIVYPTDTVYGIGCDPFNEKALRRLLKVKGREEKPLPIIASSVRSARRVASFTPTELKLAKHFWPGALTIVLRKKENLPSLVTFGRDKVGVRVPAHPVARSLARLCGGLLIGTSANLSGMAPSKTAAEANQQFGGEVDLILDARSTEGRLSSTVVEMIGSRPKILRRGPISMAEIREALVSGEDHGRI
jgi:L-threonylcarbamoyladenylate synthase